MKIVSINLENYKRIKSGEPVFKANEGLNVLVGANNSGKTSILEAIELIFRFPKYSNNAPLFRKLAKSLNYKYEKSGTVIVDAEISMSKSEWQSFFLLLNPKEKPISADSLDILKKQFVKIQMIYTQQKGRQIEFQRTSKIGKSDFFENIEDIGLKNELSRANSFVSRLANINLFNLFENPLSLKSNNLLSDKEGFISEDKVFENKIPNQYIRAKLYYIKQNDFQKYSLLKLQLLEFFPAIKDFDINLNTKNGQFEFLLTEDIRKNGGSITVPYDVSDVGMGMQNMLVFLANILLYKPPFVLLDEPDAHMHPSLVKDFVGVLQTLSKDIQFFITTHSIPFIEAVNLTDIFNLHYAQKEGGTVIKSTTSQNELLETIENLGFNVNNFLFTGNPDLYVFTEGVSDKEFILNFAEKAGLQSVINDYSVRFINLEGKGDRYKLVKLIDKLNQSFLNNPLILILDRDEATDEEIEKFRDKYFSTNPNRLFYLSKRQIENYLIDESAIRKMVKSRLKSAEKLIEFKKENLLNKFLELAENQKEKILTNFTEELFISKSILNTRQLQDILREKRGEPIKEVSKYFATKLTENAVVAAIDLQSDAITAAEAFEKKWNIPTQKIEMCDGRQLLKDIRKWLDEKYNVSFSNLELINCFDTIPKDINDLLELMKNPDKLKAQI